MIAIETYYTIKLVVILILLSALGVSAVWLFIAIIVDKIKNKNKKKNNKLDKKKENGRS